LKHRTGPAHKRGRKPKCKEAPEERALHVRRRNAKNARSKGNSGEKKKGQATARKNSFHDSRHQAAKENDRGNGIGKLAVFLPPKEKKKPKKGCQKGGR